MRTSELRALVPRARAHAHTHTHTQTHTHAGLEVLDIGHNTLRELTGLASCVALRELVVQGNQLSNLKVHQYSNTPYCVVWRMYMLTLFDSGCLTPCRLATHTHTCMHTQHTHAYTHIHTHTST